MYVAEERSLGVPGSLNAQQTAPRRGHAPCRQRPPRKRPAPEPVGGRSVRLRGRTAPAGLSERLGNGHREPKAQRGPLQLKSDEAAAMMPLNLFSLREGGSNYPPGSAPRGTSAG